MGFGRVKSSKQEHFHLKKKKRDCGDGIYNVKVGHFLDHIHDSHRMPMKYSSVELIKRKDNHNA